MMQNISISLVKGKLPKMYKVSVMKEKLGKLNFIQIQNIYSLKYTIKIMKDKSQIGEKTLIHILNKKWNSEYVKNSYNLIF